MRNYASRSVLLELTTFLVQIVSPISIRIMPMSKCKIFRISATIEGESLCAIT